MKTKTAVIILCAGAFCAGAGIMAAVRASDLEQARIERLIDATADHCEAMPDECLSASEALGPELEALLDTELDRRLDVLCAAGSDSDCF